MVTRTGIIPAQVAPPDKKLNDTRPVKVDGLSTINPLFWQAIKKINPPIPTPIAWRTARGIDS